MNFRTVFLAGKPDGNRLFFRALFENIEGELEGESREENIGTVSGVYKIPYTLISPLPIFVIAH